MTPYYSDDLVSLYLGDFRDVDVPEPTATITDPPYGETNLRWDRWIDDWPGLIPGRVLWCFGSMRLFLEHVGEFGGWKFAQDVVWEKHSGSSLATDRFRRVHEHAVQFYRGTWRDLNHNVPRERVYGVRLAERVQRGTSKGEHLGGVKPGTTWKDDRTRLMRSVMYSRSMHRRAVHPTEKPVAVVAPLVEFSTNPGDLIYDPFAGSGTTLVVAKTLGRRAIGVEIDERYCEAAAARLAQDSLGLSRMTHPASGDHPFTPEKPGPCIFDGCVSRDRHWHFGFPGGYDNPDDPEGPSIPFTTEPEPGVRDYNGALVTPEKPRP